ncbi:glycosyltransferase family 1 protein [Candidatus Microgenomates bacterium]|nr:MAG: glycosyltransferase family 1 protein [Candidatus Microgenomates bacterium]
MGNAKKNLRAGIYDPYFHILGGAERYVLEVARCLVRDYEVTFFGVTKTQLQNASEKFGLPSHDFKTALWSMSRSNRLADLRKLDVFLYVTDGSLYLSPAKKNILLIQSPAHIPAKTLSNRIKLFSWRKILVYSRFMADIVSNKIHRKPEILFVPVEKPLTHVNKENIILSVGRFFPHLHNKKQLEMVGFFRELINEGVKNTTLYLVGSVDPGAEDYLQLVKTAAKNLPIKIITDASFEQLSKLYAKAKIYWHAAGFGEDIDKYPEKAEHFGVVTLEAMSYGAIPVVYYAGGQKELVVDGVNGFVWDTPEQLVRKTKELLSDSPQMVKLADAAVKWTQDFSQDRFCKLLYEIIEK